jgi:hypothetical protein
MKFGLQNYALTAPTEKSYLNLNNNKKNDLKYTA